MSACTLWQCELRRRAYGRLLSVGESATSAAQAVYQADNPNDIIVTHEFGSVEAAQAFANSDADVREAVELVAA